MMNKEVQEGKAI